MRFRDFVITFSIMFLVCFSASAATDGGSEADLECGTSQCETVSDVNNASHPGRVLSPASARKLAKTLLLPGEGSSDDDESEDGNR